MSPVDELTAVDTYAGVRDAAVLGTRRHGALHRALVGSTSRHVLHHAPMSVLIVRTASVVSALAPTLAVSSARSCQEVHPWLAVGVAIDVVALWAVLALGWAPTDTPTI